MKLPRFLRLGYPVWQLFGCAGAVCIAVLVGIAIVAASFGYLHFQEVGMILGHNWTGKDDCSLQQPECVRQLAVKIRKNTEIITLIYDQSVDLKTLEDGSLIQYIGISGPKSHEVLVWFYGPHELDPEGIRPLWSPPTQVVPGG